MDSEIRKIQQTHLRRDHRQGKEEPRKSPSRPSRPLKEKGKRKGWSDCSIGLETPPSLSSTTADLSSQLTGESSASASVSATDSPHAETLLLFVPP
jgi:hypothetical protein